MRKNFILIIVVITLQFLSPIGISFGETLEDAWKIGLKSDHLLKAAGQDIVSRQAELDAAKGRRLPTLNIGGDTLSWTMSRVPMRKQFNLQPLMTHP